MREFAPSPKFGRREAKRGNGFLSESWEKGKTGKCLPLPDLGEGWGEGHAFLSHT